jgi:hypothetical protein
MLWMGLVYARLIHRIPGSLYFLIYVEVAHGIEVNSA